MDFIISNKKYTKNVNRIKVKMICNYCDNNELCKSLLNMSKNDNKSVWNNIELTDDDDNIDYYVIFNKPYNNTYFDPKKTIIFQMEPWCYEEYQKWGVKTWGEWSKPDINKFLHVRSHDKYLNNCFWQLKTTYNEFKTKQIDKLYNYVSTICSSKYFDPGHIKRIDFLKFLETKNDIKIDIYNYDNHHKFKYYKGTHGDRKDVGILPYKYYFMMENNFEHNFITEKVWEPILAESLCFYYGCPNVLDYVNKDAIVLLDINDFEKSYNIMKDAIENNLWEKRIDIIRKEKQKVLDYYQFFPTLERIITYNKNFGLFNKQYKNVCFIHSYTNLIHNTDILNYILNYINDNKLIHILDAIYIVNIGNKIEKTYDNDKIHIINYSENEKLWEIPTIKLLHIFSEFNNDCNILYLHTKGVSYNVIPNQIMDWTNMMLYYNITKFESNIKLLEKYDAIGCNFLEKPHKHFSGNFWWAKSSYIRTINILNLKERHDPEWFILSNTDNYYSSHDSNINHYQNEYPKYRMKNLDDDYIYIQGLDSLGNDIYFKGKSSIENMKKICNDNKYCIGFNTLGFYKYDIGDLVKSQYIDNSNGIYIHKERYYKKYGIKLI
jgi:hypothetical protein